MEDLIETDYSRIQELIDTYADQDIGFVDASVVAVAERMRERRIATLDRRHFAVIRPTHAKAFELLP